MARLDYLKSLGLKMSLIVTDFGHVVWFVAYKLEPIKLGDFYRFHFLMVLFFGFLRVCKIGLSQSLASPFLPCIFF